MSKKSDRTVYVGNLDERVSDRVLYDILIQAGPVLDLYIPRDRETDRPKGYAFAVYETEEVAEYAVKLFSGLVTLYNRTLKFAISGQNKAFATVTPAVNAIHKPRPLGAPIGQTEISQHSEINSTSHPLNFTQEPPPPGVTHYSNGYGSPTSRQSFEFSRRVLGSTLDSISRSRSRPHPYCHS